MSQQITIQVSDQVVRHAAQIAAQRQQQIEEVLAHWLEGVVAERPVEVLSNEELLALSELQFSDEQQRAMSDLLEKNSEGTLTETESKQLDELMRLYEIGLIRKSQALRVAVQRGILEPLQL